MHTIYVPFWCQSYPPAAFIYNGKINEAWLQFVALCVMPWICAIGAYAQ